MAHSFIEAHTDEVEAFHRFARANPLHIVLLLDTYDTEAAARKIVALAPRWKEEGLVIQGVRLDSGDLAEHAFEVRQILNAGGLREVHIFASGHLDEYELHQLMRVNAPIDGFGIGSCLATSADVPYLDCAYKIQEYAGRPSRKQSEGKATWPGRKQVYRVRDQRGRLQRDVITLEGDIHEGEPLLQPVMRHGQRLAPPAPLHEIRKHVETELMSLPERLRRFEPTRPYLVEISESVRDLARFLDEEYEYAHG
jgi:nicotinate phosphoribosyltransferase